VRVRGAYLFWFLWFVVMVMIIFNLFCVFVLFFNPFMPFFWVLMIYLFFIILYLFYFPFFCCWGILGYIFGCDLISYGLILLSLWICLVMVTYGGYYAEALNKMEYLLWLVLGKIWKKAVAGLKLFPFNYCTAANVTCEMIS